MNNTLTQPGYFGLGTIMAFMLLYSPYIISIMAFLYSVLSQTLSGIIYLGLVIIISFLGSILNYSRGNVDNVQNNDLNNSPTFCPPYIFSIANDPVRYKNSLSLNSMFFGFTFGYLLTPMLNYGIYNIPLLSLLSLTTIGGLFAEHQYECINREEGMYPMWGITWALLVAVGVGCANIVSGTDYEFYFIGDKNKWLCSKPNTKQQLKCRIVPKNKIPLKN